MRNATRLAHWRKHVNQIDVRAHRRACPDCTKTTDCPALAEQRQDLGSLFDAAGLPDPAQARGALSAA